MAHLITVKVGEGDTHDCTVCPFQVEVGDDWSKCGLPESFPDCEMLIIKDLQFVRLTNLINIC